jgi:RNA polymerase sigma-70 factor (ECF subfamily)
MELRIPKINGIMEPDMNYSALLEDIPPGLSLEEETALIKAAQQDPADFGQLYRLYVKPVYRYLYSRIGQVEDVEDLTGQVFLEAIEGLRHYHHKGPFAAWLFTIARRRAIDHFRRMHPVIEFSEQSSAADASADPLAQAIRGDEARQLHDQLAKLKESDQELLRLRFAGCLSFGEIAHILRRSEAAVKMNLYRLLRRLESQLEETYE